MTRLPMTCQRAAQIIAPLINGTYKPAEGMHFGYIAVSGGTIILRPGYGARSNRIDASFSAAGMRDAFGTHGGWPAQPECSFAADKAPALIARDIQRKLIDAAGPLLAIIAGKVAEHTKADNEAQAARLAFIAANPAARVDEYRNGNWRTNWSVDGARGYVTATGVHFDYINPVTHDKAQRILAILAE